MTVISPQFLLRRLRLRHIELLDVLADEPTIHAAAMRLNLSQPAVSKMLREVEGAFGARLFVRSKAGVRATAIGIAAVRRARLIRHEVEGCAEEIAALRDGGGPLLRLGTVSVTSIVPDALIKLRRKVPNAIVHISEGPVDTLLARLLAAELDCVFGALSPDLRGSPIVHDLIPEMVYRDRICVVVSDRSPLSLKRRFRWQDLARHSWVLPPPSTVVRQALVAMFVGHGLEPPFASVETMSPVTMSALVRADSDLIGIMREEQVRREREIPGLVELSVRPIAELPPLSLFTRKTRDGSSPVVGQFSLALKEAAGISAGTSTAGKG
jgi:DNA-binding transcriptional LysR family regulator